MNREHLAEELSAYLDDDLDAAARSRVEAHLNVCAACAGTLEDLRHVVSSARRAALDAVPPDRELWTGIRARLGSPGVPTAWSITMPVAQLAAAAVLLMVLSGAAAWFLRGAVAGGAAGPDTPTVVEAEVEPVPPPEAVRPVNLADGPYESAVADLERALEQRRDDLDARTVEIIERNLKLIDAAIAQARQALDEDPGNSYLNRHLVESRRQKLDLLRRAAAIAEGN